MMSAGNAVGRGVEPLAKLTHLQPVIRERLRKIATHRLQSTDPLPTEASEPEGHVP
jgi:hypothetical protein